MELLKGNVWRFGENVDTDQILPGYAMAQPADTLHEFAMAGSEEPDFAKRVQKGDVIIAGPNFGCGSSREQAPVALKSSGVSAVIAASFARIFRRNSINIGLPVMIADIVSEVKTGDEVTVDVEKAIITVNGKAYQATPLSETSLSTIRAGGLINRVRAELEASGQI